MPKLRVGLIGLGAVAAEHIEGWGLAGNIVCGAADPNPSRPQVAHRFGVPCFASVEEMLSKVVIDVLDICTPHHLHWSQVVALSSWPGFLVVEKPLVINATQLSSLQDFLRTHPRSLIMRTNKRFEPHTKRLLQILSGVEAGKLRMEVRWHQRPEYMAERPWYRQSLIGGGGVVLGMGIHYFDLLAEQFANISVSSALLQVHKSAPNASDTTSENYARLKMQTGGSTFDLTLSCCKQAKDLPLEVIKGNLDNRHFRLERQPNSVAYLQQEFEYYTEIIGSGKSHPSHSVIIRAHELAMRVYEVGSKECIRPAPGNGSSKG